MIKAVTFDLWNTLLCDGQYGDYRIDFLTKILEKEGFSRDRHVVATTYSSAIDFFNEVYREEQRYVPVAELTEYILRNLGLRLSSGSKSMIVKGFQEAMFSDPPPLMEGAEMVLRSVHGHYRIGLISNSGVTPGRVLRRILDDYKVLQYFWCSVFSDEVGYHKPHPVIFRRAVEGLQAEMNEVMHVGDLLESDVVGAKTMGMKSVWFNAAGNRSQGCLMEHVSDYEIRTLSELMEILET